MQNSGIITFLIAGEQQTGLAISLVSRDGERTMATHLGAAVEMNSKGLNRKVFKDFGHLHLEGYLVQNHDLINTAVELAKANDMTISIDLASYNVVEDNLEFLHGIVSGFIDIVFANENEAHAFTSREDPEKALIDIASLCGTAVVKIGEKGSLVMQDNTLHHIEAVDVRCLDTTGAGDLYASGFLYGIMKGLSPEACGKSGALLAGRVIEEPGAKISKKGWDSVLHELTKMQ